MSLPLFLVDALPVGEGYTLAGPEGRHAAAVQRMRAGERLLLADGVGSLATAVITAAHKDSLDLAIEGRRFDSPASPRLVVAQGIAKGDRGELAVQAMTEVGVDEIVPWAASRCVAVWKGERGEKARDKWAATAREAAKQARRSWVPVVGPTAVSTAALAKRATFVLHEEATVPLSTVELPAGADIVLVVGPEGGITDAEVDAFMAGGATPVKLGDTVLRTSTAGVAGLVVLATRLGRW